MPKHYWISAQCLVLNGRVCDVRLLTFLGARASRQLREQKWAGRPRTQGANYQKTFVTHH